MLMKRKWPFRSCPQPSGSIPQLTSGSRWFGRPTGIASLVHQGHPVALSLRLYWGLSGELPASPLTLRTMVPRTNCRDLQLGEVRSVTSYAPTKLSAASLTLVCAAVREAATDSNSNPPAAKRANMLLMPIRCC